MLRQSTMRALFATGIVLWTSCSDDDADPAADGGGAGGGASLNDAASPVRDAATADAATADAAAADAATADAATADAATADAATAQLGFFVTSDTSSTGDLGGLSGADARCQRLAAAAGAGSRSWHAYLSVEHDPDNGGNATNARDRIGDGPWYNANGVLVAESLDALHARSGDAEVFVDETGAKINGQWEGSPTPNQHDVLTGSDATGRVLAGKTCADWTSADAGLVAQVGHSDGLGPMRNGAPPYNSWQSSHESGGCNDTAPRGGAGKLYCFASD
jgi:hypothetical protein